MIVNDPHPRPEPPREPLERIFGSVFDLVDETVEAITDDEINLRIRRLLANTDVAESTAMTGSADHGRQRSVRTRTARITNTSRWWRLGVALAATAATAAAVRLGLLTRSDAMLRLVAVLVVAVPVFVIMVLQDRGRLRHNSISLMCVACAAIAVGAIVVGTAPRAGLALEHRNGHASVTRIHPGLVDVPSSSGTSIPTTELGARPSDAPTEQGTPHVDKTINTAGGVVVARCSHSGKASILDAQPAELYAIKRRKDGPALNVAVVFNNGTSTVRVQVTCNNDVPVSIVDDVDAIPRL